MAQITDESVNAGPNGPHSSIGRAVDLFYKQNPNAPSDPNTWTPEQRNEFEPELIQLYREHRSPMTDGEDRWKRIEQSQCLSDDPGSL